MSEPCLRVYSPDDEPPAGTHHLDDVATGSPGSARPGIAGRPRAGTEESYVLLEEPGEPVLMHWANRLVPHFRRDCPHCDGVEPKSLWYIGSATLAGELVIVELTTKCWRTLAAAARSIEGPGYIGLLIRIRRAAFTASPRVLRCEQRVRVQAAWPFNTRLELARIWGVPVRPRVFRGEES